MNNIVQELYKMLENCTLCPRNCGVNRYSDKYGYCNTGTGYSIASICIHKGEEPVIKGKNGICNVFFAHCNLQCVYCQNYQISKNNYIIKNNNLCSVDEIADIIIENLNLGCEAVGFVSPGHVIPQMVDIITFIREKGYNPVFIYNTNAYDKVETLKIIEPFIDVYLPDFKYIDSKYSKTYSFSDDYQEIAMAALTEMVRQKGTNLIVNDNGQAIFGIIIRHLVLPGLVDNSINILKWIAHNLSNKIYISLMSQYYPPFSLDKYPEINRSLSPEEYDIVKEALADLEFENGWIQDINSNNYYKPDFRESHPFEY
jgi:putative pyruvate formate lyase activating enzyme